MADISKCANVNCPIRLKCYRFTSKSCQHQSYVDFKYNNGCIHFWKNEHKPTKQIY
jgi:hypothetical protein